MKHLGLCTNIEILANFANEIRALDTFSDFS